MKIKINNSEFFYNSRSDDCYFEDNPLITLAKSGIKIKEKNKGKFTEYCGGKVTDECIARAKNSNNPILRKRAVFAENARAWKHQQGGIFQTSNVPSLNLSQLFIDYDATPLSEEKPLSRDQYFLLKDQPQWQLRPSLQRKIQQYEDDQWREFAENGYVSSLYTEKPEEPKKITGMSDEMFNYRLSQEGDQDFKAYVHKKDFGEDFVTGPYGMVYKWDENGRCLGDFKAGETMTREAAVQNARNYWNMRAREWFRLLEGKEGVTQDKIDALTAASGGTVDSYNRLKRYVLQNWGNDQKIANFLKTFAITAAANGKVQNGLIKARTQQSNWFLGNHII